MDVIVRFVKIYIRYCFVGVFVMVFVMWFFFKVYIG